MYTGESFHSLILSIRLFFLCISPLRSQGKVVSSALSKHPSSGSSGFQRILQTSPFIHFPLRTKRWQPQADECRTLARYLTYYVIIQFFFPVEKTSHSILSGFASNRTRLFARYSRIVIRWWSSRAGWVSQNYLKHRSSGGRIYVRSLWLLQTRSN